MLMMEKCQNNGKYCNIQAFFYLRSVLEERGQYDTGKRIIGILVLMHFTETKRSYT